MTVQLALQPNPRDFAPQGFSSSWTDASGEEGFALRFEQDCEIYGEGEEATYYYKVVSGMVRTCKFLADGRRQIDAFHVTGDVFGVETGALRSLTAEAVSDCKIVAFRRPAAEKATVPSHFLAHVLRSLQRAQEHATLLGRRGAVEKVAAFLLDWARKSPSQGTFALVMTRLDIGDYLGLTIETVSRTLWQLERDGVIALPSVRQIRIADLDALTALNG